MKFTAAILSAAAAVSASSAVFDVTTFEASCIPHSSQCRYSFDVVKSGAGETVPVSCTLQTGSTDGTLPDVKDAPCNASSRKFSIVRSAEGLTFSVSQPESPTSDLTGSRLLPAIALVKSTTPNAQVESYSGPTLFSLTA